MAHYDRRDSDALRMIDHNKRTQQRRDNAPQYDDEDAYDAAQHTAKRQQKQSQQRGDATKNGQAKTRQRSSRVPIILAKLGAWMLIICFSILFIGINGGYSIIGLESIAKAFNDAGQQFWAITTAIKFPVIVQVDGLPTHWPLIPWAGVIGGSLLQGAIIWMKLTKQYVLWWVWVMGLLISIYDFETTFVGLGEVAWIKATENGILVQTPLAIFITFVVEVVVAVMLLVTKAK